MKYFIDRADGKVFAYEADGSQDDFIDPALEPITEEAFKAWQSTSDDPREEVIREIVELEQQVTPRRVREALLSEDKSFIRGVDDRIEQLRLKL
ncbi:hypothetical protein [Pseudomonas asplenii]|uniref:hypothetical protein n=1 Tax=Pseudomonas asplenii TaxID=53407 RepID=UPI0023625FC0|nr:hypothetical protein [Pseudomonas asplenii]